MKKDSKEYLFLLKEAESENTSGDRLKELAEFNDDLAKTVTSNPNTPIETLFKLGEYFPQELLNNPIFKLLFSINLNLLEDIPIETLGVLIQQSVVPQFLLKYAANHREAEIVEIAKMQVFISGEMSKGYQETAHRKIEQLKPRSRLYKDSHLDEIKAECDLNFLSNFVEFIPNIVLENKFLALSVVLNPDTPEQVLHKLLTRKNCLMIKQLSSKEYRYEFVQSHLVGNNNVSIDLLEQLAIEDRYKEDIIDVHLAMNPHTPPELLEKLASEQNYANDECNICKFIAENPNSSIGLLNKLAIHGGEYIRNIASKNRNTQAHSSKQPADRIKNDTNILRRLAVNRSYVVRCEAAENFNTPIDILQKLSIDENIEVRAGIAKNNSFSEQLLKELATREIDAIDNSKSKGLNVISREMQLQIDERYSVLQNILLNRNCTYEIKKVIFENFARSDTPSFNRVALFTSDYAESSVLVENSNSILWLERYAIACNSKTPTDTLKQLAKDGNRMIRATAKESLEKR